MLRLNPQSTSSYKGSRSLDKDVSNNTRQGFYEPSFNLAFGAIRYFFLFLVGLAIAQDSSAFGYQNSTTFIYAR
jgi:hypothetical protein